MGRGCDGSCSRACAYYYCDPETGEWGCLLDVMYFSLLGLLAGWWGPGVPA